MRFSVSAFYYAQFYGIYTILHVLFCEILRYSPIQ